MELTKKEAKTIYDIMNFFVNISLQKFGSQLELLEKMDKTDKGKRTSKWIEESTQEFDELQMIKAKMWNIFEDGK